MTRLATLSLDRTGYGLFRRWRRAGGIACAALLLAFLLGGASHEVSDLTGPIVDGWRIGAAEGACDEGSPLYLVETLGAIRNLCQSAIEAATAALNKREPWHPAIVGVGFFDLRQDPGHVVWRTTGNTVAVFVLFDGTRRAVFVGMGADKLLTGDYGPG